ncbi:hypothetical protein [Dethiobacter alkaliphilus]|uniref:hypothetical protein n=1 Tax=Dethiobacter alkaliphilus TaxID=427926 RepID=UPI002225D148|nr:hypothetical protein [Dethiobacter alkaliphilus]MCW3491547.1 hypothetical protein [Dethiobacter alkaliphilus]
MTVIIINRNTTSSRSAALAEIATISDMLLNFFSMSGCPNILKCNNPASMFMPIKITVSPIINKAFSLKSNCFRILLYGIL